MPKAYSKSPSSSTSGGRPQGAHTTVKSRARRAKKQSRGTRSDAANESLPASCQRTPTPSNPGAARFTRFATAKDTCRRSSGRRRGDACGEPTAASTLRTPETRICVTASGKAIDDLPLSAKRFDRHDNLAVHHKQRRRAESRRSSGGGTDGDQAGLVRPPKRNLQRHERDRVDVQPSPRCDAARKVLAGRQHATPLVRRRPAESGIGLPQDQRPRRPVATAGSPESAHP